MSEIKEKNKPKKRKQISLLEYDYELALQFDLDLNYPYKPTDFSYGSQKKVWWTILYYDLDFDKVFKLSWRGRVKQRCNGIVCPYLSNQLIREDFNSLQARYPEIAAEWDYKRNYPLTPDKVAPGTPKKVYWVYKYIDSETNEEKEYSWFAAINKRVKGLNKCPLLKQKRQVQKYNAERRYKGDNSLEALYPDIAKELHPVKNNGLLASQISAYSGKRLWWLLHYKDEETGKEFDFEWQRSVYHRTVDNEKCPFLNNRMVHPEYNSLKAKRPDLIAEMHPTKNIGIDPEKILYSSTDPICWLLHYKDERTGKEFDFEWSSPLFYRTVLGFNCPYLNKNAKAWPGFNDITSYPEYKKLVEEWAYDLNNDLRPEQFTKGSKERIFWRCNKDKRHVWRTQICSRTMGKKTKCPYCRASKWEKIVHNILFDNDIDFEIEKIFKDKEMKGYRCDIFIKSKNVLIEIDAQQHFESSKFYDRCTPFEERVARDNHRNNYAFKHNILLLRVPYPYFPNYAGDNYESKVNTIRNIVLKFIDNKQVPQEIIDFYAQYEFSNYPEVATKLNEMQNQKATSNELGIAANQ